LSTTVGTPLTVGSGGTGRLEVVGAAARVVGFAGALVVRRALVDGFGVGVGVMARDDVDGAALVVGAVGDPADGRPLVVAELQAASRAAAAMIRNRRIAPASHVGADRPAGRAGYPWGDLSEHDRTWGRTLSQRGGFSGGGQPNMQQLMKQAQKMQQQLEAAQAELAAAEVTGTAGGGLVSATVTGAGELLSLTIDPKAVDPDDVETLQDLVVAAIRDANRAVADLAAEKMGPVTGAMGGLGGGLGGLGLPGL
jgi:nucleoid-associated protein EbfC